MLPTKFINKVKDHSEDTIDQAIFELMQGQRMYEETFKGFRYTGKTKRCPVSGKRIVPGHIMRPDYAKNTEGIPKSEIAMDKVKAPKILNDDEIECMRVSGKLGRKIMNEIAGMIDVGVKTEDIDVLVHELCIQNECYPSPLNYYKFPKSVCTSVNEIICHGIPDEYVLKDGDTCNVDVTIYKNGFHGDLNETFLIGTKVTEEDIFLVDTAYKCLSEAIAVVKPGAKYNQIGKAIQKVCDESHLFSCKEYEGHGCHSLFHTSPRIRHFANNKPGVMKEGHCFTIEPMINKTSHDSIIWPDDWTVATCDGTSSAAFEHTLLVTENGCEVLTRSNDGTPWYQKQLAKYC
uniref:Methionine aminopeptidase n=1 Tax=Rhabditophanes sp. KR3021 TaxID=114890 RepID=A0AC35U3B0_9BILA